MCHTLDHCEVIPTASRYHRKATERGEDDESSYAYIQSPAFFGESCLWYGEDEVLPGERRVLCRRGFPLLSQNAAQW